MLLASLSLALAEPLCGLSAHLGEPLPSPTLPERQVVAGNKLERDAYGTPNELATRNFVVRWGDQAAVDPADAEALARHLEDIWAAEIQDLGYPRPLTTGSYKLNVYIGDSGDGAPESGGAAGYYWYDPEIFPMLVVSSLSVDDPDLAAAVAAHEFFHGVQAAAASYPFGETDFWWWEASATWITSAVFPGNPHYASLLFGQAFLPERSIHAYTYGEGGTPEFHPYGAFIYVSWLTEIAGDVDLVHRTWVDPFDTTDPMLSIEHELAALGWTLADAHGDFARRNALWDYADGEIYADSIETSGGFESPESHRPTGTVDGTTGPLAPTEPPHTFGANYWTWAAPAGSSLHFDGDPSATWSVGVVGRQLDGTLVEAAVPTIAGVGSAVIDLHDLEEAWLVVAATGALSAGEPTLDYTVEAVPPVATDTADTADTADRADTGSPRDTHGTGTTGDTGTQDPTADTGTTTTDTGTGGGIGTSAGEPSDAGCGCRAARAAGLMDLLARRRLGGDP